MNSYRRIARTAKHLAHRLYPNVADCILSSAGIASCKIDAHMTILLSNQVGDSLSYFHSEKRDFCDLGALNYLRLCLCKSAAHYSSAKMSAFLDRLVAKHVTRFLCCCKCSTVAAHLAPTLMPTYIAIGEIISLRFARLVYVFAALHDNA